MTARPWQFGRRTIGALRGKVGIAVFAQAGARAASLVASFLIVPMTLNYLGNERFGLWMAATSLVLMLATFGDGGVGNSLVTSAARAKEQSGAPGVRKVLASAFSVVIPLFVMGVIVSAIAAWLMPWQRIFNINASLANETAWVVFTVGSLVCLGFVANVVMRARAGLQQLPELSAWEGTASLMAIPALVLAMSVQASLPWMVASVLAAPLFVKFVSIALFFVKNPQFWPGWSDVGAAGARDALGSGSVFFVIAISQAVAIQSDQFLIGAIVGPSEVATYSVLLRLFTIPYILANLLFMTRWPAIAAAFTRGDMDFVRHVFWQMMQLGCGLGLVLSMALALFNRPLLDVWVGGQIVPDSALLAGMALYSVLVVAVGGFSTLFVSLDVRRAQLAISLAMMVVNLPVSVVLIHQIGAAGAIWGTAFAYTICMLVPYFWLTRSHLAIAKVIVAKG